MVFKCLKTFDIICIQLIILWQALILTSVAKKVHTVLSSTHTAYGEISDNKQQSRVSIDYTP